MSSFLPCECTYSVYPNGEKTAWLADACVKHRGKVSYEEYSKIMNRIDEWPMIEHSRRGQALCGSYSGDEGSSMEFEYYAASESMRIEFYSGDVDEAGSDCDRRFTELANKANLPIKFTRGKTSKTAILKNKTDN
jgi:hypothetical protein